MCFDSRIGFFLALDFLDFLLMHLQAACTPHDLKVSTASLASFFEETYPHGVSNPSMYIAYLAILTHFLEHKELTSRNAIA